MLFLLLSIYLTILHANCNVLCFIATFTLQCFEFCSMSTFFECMTNINVADIPIEDNNMNPEEVTLNNEQVYFAPAPSAVLFPKLKQIPDIGEIVKCIEISMVGEYADLQLSLFVARYKLFPSNVFGSSVIDSKVCYYAIFLCLLDDVFHRIVQGRD